MAKHEDKRRQSREPIVQQPREPFKPTESYRPYVPPPSPEGLVYYARKSGLPDLTKELKK